MIVELTLKITNMSTLTPIWGLWIPISSNSEGKMRKQNIFTYFFTKNQYHGYLHQNLDPIIK